MEKDLYHRRRQRLAKKMSPRSTAIISTNTEQKRSRDTFFPFRPDSYFYYLTGFQEPNALLLLDADGTSVLFCQAKDKTRETWDGYRLGPEKACEELKVNHAHPITQLEEKIVEYLVNKETVYYPFITHSGLASQVKKWLQTIHPYSRQGNTSPGCQIDLCNLLDEMRLYKDSYELGLMQSAAQISSIAHRQAMQTCATRIRQEKATYEYHLEAELLRVFRHSGAQFPAYNPIVATGSNACVLHYQQNQAMVMTDHLVLIDAGCEFQGYASDITRTFPANGTFTSPQRDLYTVVLEAQEAAIAKAQPGIDFNIPHEVAVRVISQGLLDHKLLDSNKVGSVDDVIANQSYTKYYMHRTSHWLGMDVHDCGSYTKRLLQPGMVLTIEPGIYVRAGLGAPPIFENIGIRIEDDVVITTQGNQCLSREVPVAIDAIESLMQGDILY
jgi:Xaa-Pro aminopeptidase